MNITVCIKAIKSELLSVSSDNESHLIPNPYDIFGLYDVLRLKKENPEIEVNCFSMGTNSVEECLIKCMAIGADSAYLLSDKRLAGADTVATSYAIVKALEKANRPDLIVCGYKSLDGETGQVAYGIAQRMNMKCISNVRNIEEIGEDHVVLRTSDENESRVIKVKLPAVIIYNDFTVKYMDVSLLKMKQAKRKGVNVLDVDSIGADPEKCGMKGSFTEVLNCCSIHKNKKECSLIEGSTSEKAEAIFNIINSSCV
ncbi:electron transfer flavoprotein subunit beta/FixA family protein [Ruminococcus flavefaciens]|uniref:electron transfer flavoprotein subunit beta/FixA family protein n=1 Tax=Ruminococcus flavefaciens TaxID=1265 RepID=UPI00048F4604|nr:hypothetical protein [Ruminococcus flavefaciens]